jgi:hypothetical protein
MEINERCEDRSVLYDARYKKYTVKTICFSFFNPEKAP